jgi:glucokinase
MLARAIASAAALLDIDHFILGGGVSQSGPPLFDPLRRELRQRAHLPFTRDLRVTTAALGPASGVIGAASLARHLIR